MIRTTLLAPGVALAILAGGVATAPAASAGTTWNNLSGVAVAEVKNGTTWSSVNPAAVEQAEDAPVEQTGDTTLAWGYHPGVPHCSQVSFWTRVRAALGSGECV